ncbi:MAG: phenylpyruvate tautomerase MIF-related protein [Clostridia bacterium]|nr:phenylpyruvate tautomerase MIF-related protein [Clostridia bacterium]
MPYINVNISTKLSEAEKDTLKAKLGELISTIPGKTEEVLMIGINDGYTLYFSGEKKEKVAFLEVRLYKESTFECKAEFTQKVFEVFEKDFGVTGDNLFMTFGEYDSWGFRGVLKR